jgi:hypothetical protein
MLHEESQAHSGIVQPCIPNFTAILVLKSNQHCRRSRRMLNSPIYNISWHYNPNQTESMHSSLQLRNNVIDTRYILCQRLHDL